MKKISFLIVATLFALVSCQKSIENKPELQKFYDQYKVKGSFLLYDVKNDKYIGYDAERVRQDFVPSATLDILNSLVGIENGIIKDEKFTLKWDSTQKFSVSEWNKDQNLRSALSLSCPWFFQYVVKQAGDAKITDALIKCEYGNKDTSDLKDLWSGKLRINSEQQVILLKNLYENRLPFSANAHDMVKAALLKKEAKDTTDYSLSAKIGWGNQDGTQIGWYIGYVVKKDSLFIFANNIETKSQNDSLFKIGRQDIAELILKELKVIK